MLTGNLVLSKEAQEQLEATWEKLDELSLETLAELA